MSEEAFPFKKYDGEEMKSAKPWMSYYYVPEPMWYEEEIKVSQIFVFPSFVSLLATSHPFTFCLEKDDHDNEAKVDVPVDEGFFKSLFGNNLLKNVDNVQSEVSTVAALSNTRLVCCYFSAHWCPPCRNFTPLLAEFYEHLKSVYPSHGLEIVFISKDRDEPSFRNYFRSMPWLSVPFHNESGKDFRRQISER